MPIFDKDELRKKFSDRASFSEIVEHYEKLGVSKDLVLCQVKVNGEIFGEESDFSGLFLEQIEDLELEYVPRRDLFQGASESLIDHLSSVASFSEEIGRTILDSAHANRTQRLDHFMVSLKGVTVMLMGFKRTLASEGAIHEKCGLWSPAERSLSTLVEAMVLASEIKDYDLLSNLLEYDLPEALKEWQELLRDGKRGLLQRNENQPSA